MKLRSAEAGDLPKLEALINRAYRGEESKKGWTTEAHLLTGTRVDRKLLTTYLADTAVNFLLALDGDEIKACVYLKALNSALYLGLLTVDPDHQAGGIGRFLLLAAEDYALKLTISKIQITVIADRKELIEWYERRSFYLTGEAVQFPTDIKFGVPKKPLQLLVMEKDLKA